MDKAFAAYLRSCDAGELSSREEFLSQFPELSDQLKELIDAADMIGNFTTGSSGAINEGDQNQFADQKDEFGAEPGAETIGLNEVGRQLGLTGELSGGDPAVTLPMANRAKGDPGPTLPFDLGDYLLLDVIGRGGMGIVYRAKQSELDREVAVKMIRSGMLASESEVRRFYTEAQAAARLHHPGIVSVFQFGHRAGHHFFSMEYVRGTDLQRKINNGQLQVNEAVGYVRDVALAIHHAHQKGVLHRDLKPANVLIDERNKILVTDFGLAKHLDCDSSVTGSGDAIGTPHYMAPEQASGLSDRANAQSDVYSLGAILFSALAGRPPIVADTVMQTLVNVVHDPAPLIRSLRPDVPIDIETIIAKCLEKKPAKRYESAAKLADELNAFLEGRPIEARPRSRAMKTWHWIEGIPLVGAIMGRRILHGSDSHRRFQAALLLLLLMTPFFAVAAFAMLQSYQDAIPATVRFAGGIEGGRYTQISEALADRIKTRHGAKTLVMNSSGSLVNRDRLMRGQIDLAPMQATAISGDRLRVVAPLFYELLYVFARKDTAIESLADLKNATVAIGPDGSGSQATAELVFASLGFDQAAVNRRVDSWQDLFSDQPPDAAMICIGRGSNLVNRLIESGRWRLIPIQQSVQISLQHPTLRPMTIVRSDFSSLDLPAFESSKQNPTSDWPADGIPTVGTTGFLAAMDDAPAELIVAALESLYADPPLGTDLIPRSNAAEWQGLAFHRAARRFYESK
ncbi:Serine/threonine-protein kinase PrkC [Rubripirellula obstinata]|uniref:non-specific serine/threonine protein kinase n=1 Tax=Rubripirellula obstinata TaxID=406547 RepID=A0A5B1CS42_9BACT|nr:serine/threonine-protein kinase [Rubripirellula obstinata]KAA1262490.1 Serine/threonine-protein kinase PrkC [Rubripirellula obstinata]